MKYIIGAFLIFGTISFSQGQALNNIDCQSYKNGLFVTKGGIFDSRYAMKRKGKKQVEIDQNGSKFIFAVKWLDDCTYTLKLKRIAKNPMNIQMAQNDSIIVRIEQVTANGYETKSTTSDGLTTTTKIQKVKRKVAKRYLREEGFNPALVVEEKKSK